MRKFKISIITVNYNNATGLLATIESVVAQNYSDFEYIIIDGGSTDGSKEIIERYQNKLNYWVSEPDAGIYNAMNKGIRTANGEYLLFLNSGDSLAGNNILDQAANLITGDHGIYYGDIFYGESGVRKFPDLLPFSYFFEHNISHQATFIKRSLFEELFYYNEKYTVVSDWEFFIYAICRENIPYKHLDLVITRYDVSGISSDISNHPGMHRERAETIARYFPALISDYEKLKVLQSNRGRQYLRIKKNKLTWLILKSIMSVLSLFVRENRNNTGISNL